MGDNDPDLNVDRTATLLVGTGTTVYAVAPTRYSEFALLADRTGGQFYNIPGKAPICRWSLRAGARFCSHCGGRLK
jgi:hypothetical protein